MKWGFALLFLVVLCQAQEAQVRQAEQAWAEAVQRGDTAALERLYSERLIYAHSTGAVETRQQYLDRMKSGLQRYDRVAFESTRVVIEGGAAVSHSFLRMSGTSNGRRFDDYLMMLHVWVKQRGVWRLVAHQTTKLSG